MQNASSYSIFAEHNWEAVYSSLLQRIMHIFSSLRDWLWPVATGRSTVEPTDGLSEAGKRNLYRSLRKACALLPAGHMVVDAHGNRLSIVVTWSPDKGPTLREPYHFALNGADKTVVFSDEDRVSGDNRVLDTGGVSSNGEAFCTDEAFIGGCAFSSDGNVMPAPLPKKSFGTVTASVRCRCGRKERSASYKENGIFGESGGYGEYGKRQGIHLQDSRYDAMPLPLLCTHYLFRYNLLTEQTEYAKIKAAPMDNEVRAADNAPVTNGRAAETKKEQEGNPYHILYKPMDERAVNGICLSALQDGIDCWDRDVRRYLRSDRIEGYHPFELYLDMLPSWDGVDRVTPLAHRVSSDEVWTQAFHRWLLAMVAQWRGMDGNCANSVAPLLVSTEQGWGKSTFARTLLPPELRPYFTESFDLNAASSAELKLARFGLINLDEYDKLTASRQPLLKNLMQMGSLNVRRAYHQQSEPLRRIASFIGTSNRRDLLSDPTGSRRFICVELERPIDPSPLDHAQLYAQLLHELASGKRYWFSKEEELEIQRNNRRFYAQSPLEEVLRGYFTFCNEREEGARLLSSADIYQELQRVNPAALRGTTCTQLSRLLPVIGQKVHTRYGNGYWVKKV